MNGDHPEDNLLIAHAFGDPAIQTSTMIGLDESAGIWQVDDGQGPRELRVDWPTGPISERPEIRREVVLLYRAACERLGVQPREEEQKPAAHGHHAPHSPHSQGDHDVSTPKPFSQIIREGSWSDHDASEGADFMASIMQGTGTIGDYTELVVQHYYMYVALEAASNAHASNEAFAPFHDEALARLEAIEVDLVHLLGDDWRSKISPVNATAEYAERIDEISAEGWIPGLVAHHYTRYLGDLSGGQMIARRVTDQFSFDGAGAEFYNFESLGSIPEFKERYRAALDALGETLSEDERTRMLEEVRTAYSFNTRVFIDLAKRQAAARV